MNENIMYIIAVIVVIVIVAFFSITGKVTEEQKFSKQLGPYTVTRVIDGDTLVLNSTEKVRLSGINTPETGECYYNEAKEKLQSLTLNKSVFLERDITDIDKYDRLLRYVYVENVSINFLLVEQGYAKVYDKYKDDTKYYSQLKLVEEKAYGTGVWLCQNFLENCSYVGSKNSNIYHPANSSIAKRINPENIVCFKSKTEAEQAGYIESK